MKYYSIRIIHKTDPAELPHSRLDANGNVVFRNEHAELHKAINLLNVQAYKDQQGCPVCRVEFAIVEVS